MEIKQLKVRAVITIVLLSAASAMGAAEANDAPVFILKNSWYFDPGLIPELPQIVTSQGPSAGWNRMRYPQISSIPLPAMPKKEPGRFRYFLKLRNDSGKQIRRILWDYLFLNPDSNMVDSIVHFDSPVSIKPGKTKQLEGQTDVSPTRSLNARTKDADPGKFERIQIVKLYFRDGTSWDGN